MTKRLEDLSNVQPPSKYLKQKDKVSVCKVEKETSGAVYIKQKHIRWLEL